MKYFYKNQYNELSALNSSILYCGMSWKYVKCYNELQVNASSNWRENLSLTPLKYKLYRIQGLITATVLKNKLCGIRKSIMATVLKCNQRQN